MDKNFYVRRFGLPEDRIKLFDELTGDQKVMVFWLFNAIKPDDYVYAIKRNGGLVSRREKRDLEMETFYDE